MYRPRLADLELKQRLEATGAVVVEGPKACGKTELAHQLAASKVLLDIDAEARRAIAAALLKFRDRIDLNKCGAPTTLGVTTPA